MAVHLNQCFSQTRSLLLLQWAQIVFAIFLFVLIFFLRSCCNAMRAVCRMSQGGAPPGVCRAELCYGMFCYVLLRCREEGSRGTLGRKKKKGERRKKALCWNVVVWLPKRYVICMLTTAKWIDYSTSRAVSGCVEYSAAAANLLVMASRIEDW